MYTTHFQQILYSQEVGKLAPTTSTFILVIMNTHRCVSNLLIFYIPLIIVATLRSAIL